MMLDRWGGFVNGHRLVVLAASVVLFLLSATGLLFGGTLSTQGFGNLGTPAEQAQQVIDQQFGSPHDQPGNQVLVMLHSSTARVGEPAFDGAVARAVAALRRDPRVTAVASPLVGERVLASQLVSSDRHAVLLELMVSGASAQVAAVAPELGRQAAQAAGEGFDATVTGHALVEHSLLSTLQSDLTRGETISVPITLLLLLLIFGSVVAGLLPLGIGVLAVLGGIGAALALANVTSISEFALDLIPLIGLGVSIDYSLFIVSRFKEELARGSTTEEALRIALATAGRAVTFSGITVAVALCALVFIPHTYAVSMGYSSAIGVLLAVVFSLTFLPALLSLLGRRVNRLSLPLPRLLGGQARGRFWRGLAGLVMRRPMLVLWPTLAALLLAGTPFLHIHLADAGVDTLPPHNAARGAQERVEQAFPATAETAFPVVVRFRSGPLTASRVGEVYDLSHRIARLPDVSGVEGPFETVPGLSRAGYQRLLTQPPAALPSSLRAGLQSTVRSQAVLITATSAVSPSSQEAADLVARLRAEEVPGADVLVAGESASTVDNAAYVIGHVPWVVGFVVVMTLVILFLLTGSLLLPLASVCTNLISIAASLGALVWVFQDGHLAQVLDFTPQPIDPSVPVLVFAAVFGLSMDYQVLLLSRIQEQRAAGLEIREAVAAGLAGSAGLITGAAAIMVTVFLAFALADVVIIKSIGLALALAVALDATLVRALIVPSLLRLLGPSAWWAPAPIQRWVLGAVGAPRAH